MKIAIVDRLIKDLRVSLAGVKEGIERVAEKADLKMRVAKISIEISGLEEDLEKAYQALGDVVYREAISRPDGFYEIGEAQTAVRTIRDVTEKIREREWQIERIQEGQIEEQLVETAGHLKEGDWTVETFRVSAGSKADGSRLSDAGNPRDILVVGIVRGESYLLPKGDTLLQPADVVTVIARKKNRTVIENWLCSS